MANPFAQFLDLIPKSKRTVAKITTADNGSGQVEVELPGTGQHLLVRSNGSNAIYPVGTFVYIVDGIIQARTPNISAVEEITIV